jgi:hypothetical protein
MNNLNENINRIKKLMNLSEDKDGFNDFYKQDYTGQLGPHDEDDMAPDGMDDDSDIDEGEFLEYEISEEGETEGSTSTGGGGTPSAGYPTVTKWETGLTRGPANPVTSAKRQDKVARGKANTLI